ncbi:MAG: fumarylacetoacetate hydrolase family protein [Deltaproteobacteria bacterium]|nr:fumarylacetoacetate hydrolase family protein [Deltaproteobacteria bacterium]
MLNLQAAAALYLKEVEKEKRPYLLASQLIPTDMGAFLAQGEQAMNLARLTFDFIRQRQQEGEKSLKGLRGEALIFSLAEIVRKAPVARPGKIIAMGLNFHDHAQENKVPPPEFPVAFLKATSALIGPDEPVPYPHYTKELDYEIELAIVIGKKGKDIPKEKAFEHIAGYTIFNDLSARDLQAREMKMRLLLLGKSLDALAPMGPYLVTRDEIADPHALSMELRVNDEPQPRQRSSTGQMIFKIQDLVAYWSQMTLEPGDIITSGTPGGVALFRQPNPGAWFLKPGDVVEARIEGLGVLRNRIIAG